MYSNNPSFRCGDAINQICSGLFKRVGLNAFSYSIVYKDLSRAELWTDLSALEYSFFEKQYIPRVYTPDLIGDKKCFLYEYEIENFPREIEKKLRKQLSDQRELFDHDNCFFIVVN